MNEIKTILVTNDDGVNAPGLLALAQEMRKIANVLILAPDRNWSGSGHVKTLERPLRIKEVVLADGTSAFASDGAPSDCVALALLGFFDEKIDLVVSGINPMPNFGHDVTYSGTVTAAMEALIWETPGIAFSLGTNETHREPLSYFAAARIAHQIVEKAIERHLQSDYLLNVNIPYLPPEEIKGIRITRQGLRVYRDRLDRRMDPRGRPYFWIGGDAPTGVSEVGTDIGALSEGYVSINPIQLDLTMYTAIPALGNWDWKMPGDVQVGINVNLMLTKPSLDLNSEVGK
jgi:5'-nucleotidase